MQRVEDGKCKFLRERIISAFLEMGRAAKANKAKHLLRHKALEAYFLYEQQSKNSAICRLVVLFHLVMKASELSII